MSQVHVSQKRAQNQHRSGSEYQDRLSFNVPTNVDQLAEGSKSRSLLDVLSGDVNLVGDTGSKEVSYIPPGSDPSARMKSHKQLSVPTLVDQRLHLQQDDLKAESSFLRPIGGDSMGLEPSTVGWRRAFAGGSRDNIEMRSGQRKAENKKITAHIIGWTDEELKKHRELEKNENTNSGGPHLDLTIPS